MANRNINGDVNVEFNEASSRQGLDSGESVKTLFGKIRKWLSDLKAVAFSGSYNDLTNKPTIPPAVAVKGSAETAYRTGNVNLTAANIGAATSAQGTKADSAVQTIQIGGTMQTKTDGVVNLPAYPTKSSLGLGNVNNTSDLDKPISTATQAALDSQQEKIDKALEQTGYNLLPITVASQTIKGVTFTIDKAAGTITANGTATSTIWSLILLSSKIFTENVVVSGCPTGGNYTDKYSIQTDAVDGTTYYDFGRGFTFPANKAMTLRIVIRSGYTCNNLVFKPMIVPAELAGVPFQPYAKSNIELTQDLDDVSEELDCLVIRAALVNDEVRIQNTSDFTDELYSKYYSRTEPKFAILELYDTSNTYYYKALINSSSVRQAIEMKASFITVNGTYMSIYKFSWNRSGTVGTPTVSHTSLNFGS